MFMPSKMQFILENDGLKIVFLTILYFQSYQIYSFIINSCILDSMFTFMAFCHYSYHGLIMYMLHLYSLYYFIIKVKF